MICRKFLIYQTVWRQILEDISLINTVFTLPIKQNPTLVFFFLLMFGILAEVELGPSYKSPTEPYACLDPAHVCRFTHPAAPNWQAVGGHCLSSHYFKDVLGMGEWDPNGPTRIFHENHPSAYPARKRRRRREQCHQPRPSRLQNTAEMIPRSV